MYEVKTDFQAHKSGNLTYEHISRKVGLKVVGVGCFAKTAATYILYAIPGADKILKINTLKLREIVGRNFVSGMYTTREILNQDTNGNVIKGEVIICPFETIEEAIEEDIEFFFEEYIDIAKEEESNKVKSNMDDLFAFQEEEDE